MSLYAQLTTDEVAARIAHMSARPDLHRVPVVGTTEDIADVSREVAAQLHAPGDGCWYLSSATIAAYRAKVTEEMYANCSSLRALATLRA